MIGSVGLGFEARGEIYEIHKIYTYSLSMFSNAGYPYILQAP